MRLYIKQKVFSLKDKFYVKDENGEDRYYVEGKILSIGKQLWIRDMEGNELAFLKQKVITFLPRFFIYINGEEVAQIVKKFTLLKPKYEISGPGWTINGNFLDHDYTIESNGVAVAGIHKKWMSWGDSYEMEINPDVDQVLALAVILAIDTVMDNNNQ